MHILKRLIRWVLIGTVVIMTSAFLVSALNPRNDEGISIFGVSAYVVVSDSMVPKFAAGDVIIIQAVDSEDLSVGDVITFRSRDPNTFGEIISHEIYDIVFNNIDETLSFITRGINLGTIDATPVLSTEIIGKLIFSIPRIGIVVNFARSTIGFISLFVIPMTILIGFEIFRFLKQYQLYLKEKILNGLPTGTTQGLPETKDNAIKDLEEQIKRMKEENERLKKGK
jgi:signal peptidase